MPTKTDSNKNDLTLKAKSKADRTKRLNELAVSADMLNATLALPFYGSIANEVSLNNIVGGLKQQIAAVQAGDMTSIEAMLVALANSLQTMFVSLGRMAANKTQLVQYTAFMNLALKAQSQSRATIQALVELKYPKQTNFVKQANITNGHHQINNNAPAPSTKKTSTRARARAPAKEINKQPNELLEVNNGRKTMDVRTTQTTILKVKAMATVAALHRS